MDPVYACIDLKSFYASVECVARGLDPLTARLVVADEERTDKTICLAVSPALKALGVPSRPRLFEVKERLALIKAMTGREVDIITATPRMALYVETSAKIYGIYLKYVSPEDVHLYSIDEVFLDLTRYLKPRKSTARDMTVEMIRDVLASTGITATAGIGTNMYLAKVAMDIVAKKKPADADGVRIAELDEEGFKKTLWDHLPITDFWQTGPGTEARLRGLGVRTMGDLARLSLRNEDILYRNFGVDAELLIDHAWGRESCTMGDIKAYTPSARSVSSGQVLSRAYSFDEARIVLREMAEEMTMELMERGLVTDAVTLRVGYDCGDAGSGYALTADRYGRLRPESTGGTAPLEVPTYTLSRITSAVLDLYDRVTDRELGVRRLTVTAIRLLPEDQVFTQLDMFTDPAREDRELGLQRAVMEVRRKYGRASLMRGHDYLEGATAIARSGQIGGHRK